jgi:gluconokinase
LIDARLRERRGHFMSPALIDSQFAALQEPEASEPVISVDAAAPLNDIVQQVSARIPR